MKNIETLLKKTLKKNNIREINWYYDIVYWTILLQKETKVQIRNNKEFINKIDSILNQNLIINTITNIEIEKNIWYYNINVFDEDNYNKFLIVIGKNENQKN